MAFLFRVGTFGRHPPWRHVAVLLGRHGLESQQGLFAAQTDGGCTRGECLEPAVVGPGSHSSFSDPHQISLCMQIIHHAARIYVRVCTSTVRRRPQSRAVSTRLVARMYFVHILPNGMVADASSRSDGRQVNKSTYSGAKGDVSSTSVALTAPYGVRVHPRIIAQSPGMGLEGPFPVVCRPVQPCAYRITRRCTRRLLAGQCHPFRDSALLCPQNLDRARLSTRGH